MMQTLKGAAIWLAWGLVPVATVMVGLLPDSDRLSRFMLPTFMATLFLWLLGGLVMVATWYEHRLNRTADVDSGA